MRLSEDKYYCTLDLITELFLDNKIRKTYASYTLSKLRGIHYEEYIQYLSMKYKNSVCDVYSHGESVILEFSYDQFGILIYCTNNSYGFCTRLDFVEISSYEKTEK